MMIGSNQTNANIPTMADNNKYKLNVYKKNLRSFMENEKIELIELGRYYQTFYQINNLKFIDFVKNIFFVNSDLLNIDKLKTILNFLLNILMDEFPKLTRRQNIEK